MDFEYNKSDINKFNLFSKQELLACLKVIFKITQ